MTGFNTGLSNIVSWVLRLAILNIYGIFAALIGLLFFGFFPAITAVYAMIRRWILHLEEEPSFSRSFWCTYKNNFINANIIGWILLAVGYILYIDFRFLQELSGVFHTLMAFILMTITLIYTTVVLYIFPVYVHYDIKLSQTFKYALIIGISFPFATICMIAVVAAVCLISVVYSALLPFFSLSLLLYGIMLCALYSFQKISKKGTDAPALTER